MSSQDSNAKGFADPASAGDSIAAKSSADTVASKPRKGPLSFFSGSATSLVLAWFSWGLSKRMVLYFAEHPPISVRRSPRASPPHSRR